MKSLLASTFAVSTALCLAPTAHAQFRTIPVTPNYVRPYCGPSFYPYPGYNNGAGDYLQGAASVIDAQGQYLQDVQKAYLLKEQVTNAKLDTQKKVFEQNKYELANTQTLEEQREYQRKQEFWRSWNNPPLTEIWSGKSLNDLLDTFQKAQREQGYRGPVIPLDSELVRHINVTQGTTSTSLGVLSPGQPLRWPLPLQREYFDKQRNEIAKLAPVVVQEVGSGNPQVKSFDALNKAIGDLRAHLKDNVDQMASTDYIQSLRYVNQLMDGMKALQDPAAANYFTKWTLAATNVGDLVNDMTQKGIKFAPVTIGNENYYTALQQAMVAYGSGLSYESLRELRSKFYSLNTK